MADFRITNDLSTLSYAAGTGTISIVAGSVNIVGVGTLLNTELTAGMVILAAGQYLCFVSASNSTHAVVQTGPAVSISGATFQYAFMPAIDVPIPDYLRWNESIDLGNALARGQGRPSCTWTWTNIDTAVFATLQGYCPGKSARVYIRTINNLRLGTYQSYIAAMLWTDVEDVHGSTSQMPFKVEFRDLVLF